MCLSAVYIIPINMLPPLPLLKFTTSTLFSGSNLIRITSVISLGSLLPRTVNGYLRWSSEEDFEGKESGESKEGVGKGGGEGTGMR